MGQIEFPVMIGRYEIKSYKELEQMAEQNDMDAMFLYAEGLWHGEGYSKDSYEATRNYILSAILGNKDSLLKLADMYRYGQNVERNEMLAAKLLQASYALGSLKALTEYAMLLLEGNICDNQEEAGIVLLKSAYDQGDEDAEYFIEEYYPDAMQCEVKIDISEEEKMEWYESAMESLVRNEIKRIDAQLMYAGIPEKGSKLYTYYQRLALVCQEISNRYTHNETDYKGKDDLPKKAGEPHAGRMNVGMRSGLAWANASDANSLYRYNLFHGRNGHGYAAESANHIADLLSGKRSVILGDDLAKNGPDRMVNGMLLQSKYCKNGADCIGKAFENGTYKYIDKETGKPMAIEVPHDLDIYNSAIKAMEKRILKGEVPDVSDPARAKDLVKRGVVTYDQALCIAKSGTVESVVFDAANGLVVAESSFGISAAISFAVGLWNGEDWKDAMRLAAINGLKVAGTAFVTSVISRQVTRVLIERGITQTIDHVSGVMFDALGKKATGWYISASKLGTVDLGSTEAMKDAGRMFRNELVTGAVSLAVLSVPSIIDVFRGRISKAQLFKNVVNTSVGLAAGSVGRKAGAYVGSRLLCFVPCVGPLIGGLVGAAIASSLATSASGSVLDSFIEDDSKQMLAIIENNFQFIISNYLFTQEETEEIMDLLNNDLDARTLKEMYASADRDDFAVKLIEPHCIHIAERRRRVSLPDETAMINVIRDLLENLADEYSRYPTNI